MPAKNAEAAPQFRDVPQSHAFYNEISWLASTGITTGWPDGTFRPGQPVERAAYAAFLYRMAGKPAFSAPAAPTFRDVPKSHPFYKEIEWAAAKGITTGWPDGTFRPSAKIARDAIAAFMYRFACKPSYTAPAVSPFRDVPTNRMFYKEISWMKQSGLSTGWADGTYRPANNTERGAIAAFLYRYSQKGYPKGACQAGAASFRDVPASHQFNKEISWLASTGITTGWSDGTFRPAAAVERGAYAAFLYRMAGKPAFNPPATPSFKDVPKSHPFFKEIEWALSKGITTGWPDGTFRPSAKIARDAIAAFMYRFACQPQYAAPASSQFRDVATSHPFYKEISWMKQSGLSNGWADGTYRPANNTDRGAIAAFLYRYSQKGYSKGECAAPVNVLVVGLDNYTDMHRSKNIHADSIMVVQVSANRQDISVMSIPRDTYVDIPGVNGKQKINDAYDIGRGDLQKRTVEQLTGIPINYVMETNFSNFGTLTDAIGGVPIDTRGTFRSNNVLEVVRARQNLPQGDYDRVRRSQGWMLGAIEKGFSAELLKDPAKALSLYQTYKKYVYTDLPDTEAVKLALEVGNAAKGKRVGVTEPWTSGPLAIASHVNATQPVWVSYVDVEKARPLWNAFKGGYSAKYITDNQKSLDTLGTPSSRWVQ